MRDLEQRLRKLALAEQQGRHIAQILAEDVVKAWRGVETERLTDAVLSSQPGTDRDDAVHALKAHTAFWRGLDSIVAAGTRAQHEMAKLKENKND